MEKPNWLSQMPGEDVPDNQPWTLHGLKMDQVRCQDVVSAAAAGSLGASAAAIRVASLSREVLEQCTF